MTIVTECSVCTDELTNECIITCCPCGHIFHKDCMDQWLRTCKTQPVCPCCRTKAPRRDIVKQLYFAIPNNTTISGSPSKDASRLRNRVSTLEAQLLKEQANGRESHDQVAELKGEVDKLKKSRTKLKLKEQSDATRMSALKVKSDHYMNEAEGLRGRLSMLQKQYDSVKGLENDRRLLERVKELRDLTRTDDGEWLQALHNKGDVREMQKYQKMLQSEFVKTVSVNDKQASQILILEKELRREKHKNENLTEDADASRRKCQSAVSETAALREKIELIKASDPNSTNYVRLCVESPLSDDLLARVKELGNRKRRSDEDEFKTPSTPPKRPCRTPSTFGDDSFFNNALAAADDPDSMTPDCPLKQTKPSRLIIDCSDDEEDSDSLISPVISRTKSVFNKIKVKTAPLRSPKKKQAPRCSPLDVSKIVAQSNLFKKEKSNRANRPFNGLGGSSRNNPVKLKSASRSKPNIRDFFVNTKMT